MLKNIKYYASGGRTRNGSATSPSTSLSIVRKHLSGRGGGAIVPAESIYLASKKLLVSSIAPLIVYRVSRRWIRETQRAAHFSSFSSCRPVAPRRWYRATVFARRRAGKKTSGLPVFPLGFLRRFIIPPNLLERSRGCWCACARGRTGGREEEGGGGGARVRRQDAVCFRLPASRRESEIDVDDRAHERRRRRPHFTA